MPADKNEIIASVARARIELDQVLEDLQCLPARDPIVSGFICRALENYLHISSATLSLLHEALENHSEAKVLTWLDGLKTVTERMHHLVDEMKGAPTKEPRTLNFREVDIATLIGRACEFYRPVAGRKKIQIALQNEMGTTGSIWTDRIALAAIMDNLLSNAVASSPAGKAVFVKLEAQEASVICAVRYRTEGSIRLGPRLFRKPSAGSKRDGSQDYGLAVAGELVALLGGKIWCEREPNNDASLIFSLPSSRRSPRARRGENNDQS